MIDATESNWIAFLIGKIPEAELVPANRRRLEAQHKARKETIEAGEVPLKPFWGGVVDGEEEQEPQIMVEGVKILEGPFPTRKEAWVAQERINPEGWSGERTPKALQGFDGQWYVAVLPKRAYGDD